MKLPTPKFRIAPTPSGFIHRGNAINFILTTALCAHYNGQLLLRIDDLDQTRFKPKYLNDLYEQLAFLLPKQWFEMAMDNCFFQSKRINRYQEVLKELEQNELLYACQCSRKKLNQVNKHYNINQYYGYCKDQKIDLNTTNVAWRIKTTSTTPSILTFNDKTIIQLEKEVGRDMVVRQKNKVPAYLLASICDDYDFHISHIVRGKDLLQSSFMQQSITSICKSINTISSEWAPRFCHHELIVNEDGQKLSKSAGSKSLRQITPTKETRSKLIDLCITILSNSPLKNDKPLIERLFSWKLIKY